LLEEYVYAIPLENVCNLVYGGDVLLGNELNAAVYSKEMLDEVFGDIAPIFRRADIALVNAEGVIARGGSHGYKGERNPHLFRTHPDILRAFVDAKIDVVTVGNNHVLDFGREAFVEMLDRLSVADIQYIGGGHDLEDAEHPAYFKVRDIVVAIVATNMSYTKLYAADSNRPGTLHLEGRGNPIDEVAFSTLERILKKAKKHAHLVFLSPHWGDGWTSETRPAIRKFAARLIKAGYDGILGHSAHRFQGAEVIDGRPVLYDAGNLVAYWRIEEGQSNRGLLYQLLFTKSGVTDVIAYPLHLKYSSTILADRRLGNKMLRKFQRLSKKLDTPVEMLDDIALIRCTPRSTPHEPTEAYFLERPKRRSVRIAPLSYILNALPDDVVPLDVRYRNGLHIVGVKFEPTLVPRQKNNVLLTLFFKTDKEISDSLYVHLEWRGKGKEGQEITRDYHHIPGDWLCPTTEWPQGRIIRDQIHLRELKTQPPEKVTFYAGIKGHTPVFSSKGIVKDKLIPIGEIEYVEDGPGVTDILKILRATK
jgi:poly-gamma-glutamate synthesis protein (capsule biosynthesis protein)